MSHPRSTFLYVTKIHGFHLLFLKAYVSNVKLPFAPSDVTSVILCDADSQVLHLLFLEAHVSNVELPFARSDVTSVRKGRSQYTGTALDQRPQVKARAS